MSHTANDAEIRARREAAMQRLRQHYIEAQEKHQPFFAEAEAELREFESKQSTLKQKATKPHKPKTTRKPHHAAKRVPH